MHCRGIYGTMMKPNVNKLKATFHNDVGIPTFIFLIHRLRCHPVDILSATVCNYVFAPSSPPGNIVTRIRDHLTTKLSNHRSRYLRQCIRTYGQAEDLSYQTEPMPKLVSLLLAHEIDIFGAS